jgi:putative ABC transport system permease protein
MTRRDPPALALCLFLVRLASRIVPRRDREHWRREWEGELRHRWSRGRVASRRHEAEMVRRSLGALVDAAWLRRQFTLDAEVVHDLSHGVRMLIKAPGFTALSLLVLAIGIGASTAMASIADALLFRRLAIPEPERVLTLWERNLTSGVGGQDVAPGNAIDLVSRTTAFAAIAAVEPWSVDLATPGGEPENLNAARVSRGFFDVLGVPMLHGRSFLPHEYADGAERVVVLSHGLWRDRFGADPAVVGRPIAIDYQSYVAVGVMRPGIELRLFDAKREPRAYLPKYFEDFEPRIRSSGYWNVLGRLKPGISLEQARRELDVLSAQLAREYPNSNRDKTAEAVPIRDHLAGSVRGLLPVLLGASGLLLLVACANVGSLLLGRGAARAREFAVRKALGAGRARLIRQMLTESLLLAIGGGVIGVLFAWRSLHAITLLRPIDVSGLDQISLDLRVTAIACGLSLLASLVAGLAPAWQLSRPAAAVALRAGASGPTTRRTQNLLAVVEVCLAVLLAVGAGLLVRSLLQIQRVDPGFVGSQVTALQVFAYDRNDTPQKIAAFFESALERLRAVPGAAVVGAVSAMPFSEANLNIRSSIAIDGRPPSVPGDAALIYTTIVAGDYFRAMSIPLERGRLFDRTDRADSAGVALVSRSAARKFWPGSDPIGAKIKVRFTGRTIESEVVGIVGDARHEGLDRAPRPELFLPHPQVPFGGMTFVVRMHPGSPATLRQLKEQIWAVDPRQAFYNTSTVEQLVSRTLVGRRFLVVILSGFGVAALLLAAAGLYGVMSFSTGQRSREFGVRIALGARPADILSMVVREGLALALLGIGVGVLLALFLTRLLRGLLFGVSSTDPVTFAAVAAGIMMISAASCYLPARRAVRADPLVTLKIN